MVVALVVAVAAIHHGVALLDKFFPFATLVAGIAYLIAWVIIFCLVAGIAYLIAWVIIFWIIVGIEPSHGVFAITAGFV